MDNVSKQLNSIMTALKEIQKSLESPQLPSTVNPYSYAMDMYGPTFYRYIRPYSQYYAGIDSQRGVTLKIYMDYRAREIYFSYSICNHANGESSFDKEIGRVLASQHEAYTIPLWEEKGPLIGIDITEYIMHYIHDYDIIPAGDRRLILNQYFDSLCM